MREGQREEKKKRKGRMNEKEINKNKTLAIEKKLFVVDLTTFPCQSGRGQMILK